MDFRLHGKATSDPYVVIRIGARRHQSKCVKNTTDPTWGIDGCADFFEFNENQLVSIEVFDWDWGTADDLLGQLRGLRIKNLVRHPDQWLDLWLPGAVGDHGKVHILCEVLGLGSSSSSFTGRQPQKRGAGKNTALITVTLRSVRGLSKEMSTGVFVKLRCEGQEFTTNPSWYAEPHHAEIDSSAQRLIEYLSFEKNLDEAEIARAALVSEDMVKNVLSM